MIDNFLAYKKVYSDLLLSVFEGNNELVIQKPPFLNSKWTLFLGGFLILGGLVFLGQTFFLLDGAEEVAARGPFFFMGCFELVAGLFLAGHYLLVSQETKKTGRPNTKDKLIVINLQPQGTVYTQTNNQTETVGQLEDLQFKFEFQQKGTPMIAIYCREKKLVVLAIHSGFKKILEEKGFKIPLTPSVP